MSRLKATPKEWALAIGGGLALSVLLVVLLRGGDAPPPPSATMPPPTVLTPPPAVSAPAPAVTAPPPADLALTGLRSGPDGGMAIIAVGISTGKRQYMLRPGRSLPGGLRLLRVEPGQAILAGPSGEMVLRFPDAPAPAASQPSPPGGDPTPWRLALKPVRAGGAITGWRLDSLTGLPMLARAGLQVGDVIETLDSTPLISEEKIIELPQELAANGRLRLGVRRAGTLRDVTVGG